MVSFLIYSRIVNQDPQYPHEWVSNSHKWQIITFFSNHCNNSDGELSGANFACSSDTDTGCSQVIEMGNHSSIDFQDRNEVNMK